MYQEPLPPEPHVLLRWRRTVRRVKREGWRRSVRMGVRRLMSPAYHAGLAMWLVGCTLQTMSPTLTPTPIPTATPTPVPDNDWETLATGLERRILRPESGFLTQLTAIRIDPAQYTIRSHYQPGAPMVRTDWEATLPDAAVIINSNFFNRLDEITGLLIADGVSYGQPYQRRGGTFYMLDGVPGIQSNLVQPYAGEQYDQAVQAFPMLMTNGEQSYFDTRPDRATRRTVIAVDDQNRIVILITTFGGITLLDMAAYLPTTDLNLTDALNLDGGGSTFMSVSVGEDTYGLTSFDPVPAVLAAYPR
jgi:hypothetical protein